MKPALSHTEISTEWNIVQGKRASLSEENHHLTIQQATGRGIHVAWILGDSAAYSVLLQESQGHPETRLSEPPRGDCYMSEAHKLSRHFMDLPKALIKLYQYPQILCPLTSRQVLRSPALSTILSSVWPYEVLATGSC